MILLQINNNLRSRLIIVLNCYLPQNHNRTTIFCRLRIDMPHSTGALHTYHIPLAHNRTTAFYRLSKMPIRHHNLRSHNISITFGWPITDLLHSIDSLKGLWGTTFRALVTHLSNSAGS